MNNSSNNPKSHPLLKPAWIVCLLLGMILLLGACTSPEPPFSEVVIVIPEDTLTPPPSPIPTITPSPTIIPSPTPYPEGTIAWGALYEGITSEHLEVLETWAQELSQATGLNVILVPVPETEMETLEALRDGRIHMISIFPMAYLVGSERGWVEPGPIKTILGGQEADAIMFISRTDTGFLPGEPPEVFQQLEGSRACWPETTKTDLYQRSYFAIPSCMLPLGLLRLNGVEDVWPVMKESVSSQFYDPALDVAVFRKQCEFAAVPAKSFEDFLDGAPVTLEEQSEWEEKMQILYTTAPINPFGLYVFSPTLPEDVREQLSQAILANPGPNEKSEYAPFNQTLYDEFRRIVLASGVDLQSYLSAPVDEP